jgi:hypothetical protein
MASDDERHDDVPEDLDDTVTDVDRGETAPFSGGEPEPDFPQRWAAEPDDTATAGESFGDQWSKESDNSAEKAEEFGERWAAGPDDSPERAEEFGATWSGDTQAGATD